LGIDKLLKEAILKRKRNLVYETTKILHEHFNNQYIKKDMARKQINLLFTILFAILVIIIVFTHFDLLPLDEKQVPKNSEMLLAVVLFGILGGTISSIYSQLRMPIYSKIPALMDNLWITCMRTFVGGAGALAMYLFLMSGIIDFGELTVFRILAICFSAGFSEHILINAVNVVSNK